MSFMRSNSGLSNFAQFFDAEFTIYTEGGTGQKLDNQIIRSIDTTFWRTIFNKYAPGQKIKIKALGSKTAVLPYAEKIARGEISHSLAAMDKDHDDATGKKIVHKKILYSYGYSWENDVWRKEILKSYIESIHPEGELQEDELKILNLSYKNLEHHAKRIAKINLLCAVNGIQGINKNNGEELIKKERAGIHNINTNQLKRKIKSIQIDKKYKLHNTTGFESSFKDCYGKIVSAFGYAILKELLQRTTPIKTIPKDAANQMIICHLLTHKNGDTEEETDTHYSSIIRNIN